MIDLMVELWDGKQGVFEKKTKASGDDAVENPWINLIACTTPSWIAGNFPEYMIGGGFCSRTLFVYADQKREFIAYPDEYVVPGYEQLRQDLITDLTRISEMKGQMQLTAEARVWGREWYQRHYSTKRENLDNDRFGGYLARKQTHVHKLAMVLSASRGDSLEITKDDLELADVMVTDLEADMPMVFSKIGQSEESVTVQRLLGWLRDKGECPYRELYMRFHQQFPGHREFENILNGLVAAGFVLKIQRGADWIIKPIR